MTNLSQTECAEKEESNEIPSAPDLPQTKKNNTKKYIFRAGISVLTVLLAALTALYAVCRTFCFGPSPVARDKFVDSVHQASALKFIPRLFFSEEQITEILANSAPEEFKEPQDPGLIVISPDPPPENEKDTELIDISGPTYKGKLLIVRDPSRVKVAVSAQQYSSNKPGKKLVDLVNSAGAVAGINGGEFYDYAGRGNGGTPLGFVFSDGQMLASPGNGKTAMVIGFDRENRLITGSMTPAQAQAAGIRDCVSFAPVLVRNGEIAKFSSDAGGLNPRSAIGQRADGTVLLLVIDGRQAHSLGASYRDLAEIMLEYGAVNAANLDGGTSSAMIYEGEVITRISPPGAREIPTAFVVMPKEAENS